MSALRIIVFAKAPRPGLAKTRLIPALGAAGAAALAARMLAHTLDQALARLSRRLDMRLGAVILPFAEAAVDVDTPADHALVEATLAARKVTPCQT